MNALVDRLNQLAGEINAKEKETEKHEQAARVCRAEREELKREQSEINANINDARIVNSLQGSAASARAAQTIAEDAAKQMKEIIEKLEAKLVESNGESAKDSDSTPQEEYVRPESTDLVGSGIETGT